MSRRSKVTDEQLDNLSDAVDRLVKVFTEDLRAVDEGVAELAQAIGTDISILEARVNALYESPLTPQAAANELGFEDPPELEDILEDLRQRELAPAFAQDDDIDVAGEPVDDTLAWEITETGAKVFSAGGVDALSTIAALLELINDSGLENPSIVNIHVSFGQVDEQGLAFDGLATVGY
jgi:hypothetical protein